MHQVGGCSSCTTNLKQLQLEAVTYGGCSSWSCFKLVNNLNNLQLEASSCKCSSWKYSSNLNHFQFKHLRRCFKLEVVYKLEAAPTWTMLQVEAASIRADSCRRRFKKEVVEVAPPTWSSHVHRLFKLELLQVGSGSSCTFNLKQPQLSSSSYERCLKKLQHLHTSNLNNLHVKSGIMHSCQYIAILPFSQIWNMHNFFQTYFFLFFWAEKPFPFHRSCNIKCSVENFINSWSCNWHLIFLICFYEFFIFTNLSVRFVVHCALLTALHKSFFLAQN